MDKPRSSSTFSAKIPEGDNFQIKKQGFVSLQEKKLFNTWKKFWLVFKQMDIGATPRVVLDAYINEFQFRLGSSPKHTFNLTGTVSPVVVCQQSHKQVRHMFVVCPPGSRYLFECDSHFSLQSWVEDLNDSLFPRTNGMDHILTELNTSIKLCGSMRHRAKSNSMNDISKIGLDPPEIPVAPPLPPPNRRAVNTATSFPVCPEESDCSNCINNGEAVSKYRVEIEVSTFSQVPKGVCVVLVQRENIQLCHAVTLSSMATWHITHIREFKLTTDDKLIITSGNRSVTGYGQVRLSGVDTRALYYKVKTFVSSKSRKPRIAVTLPGRRGVPPVLPVKSTTMAGEVSNNGLITMTSPTKSPPISRILEETDIKQTRPLPDIPSDTVYSELTAALPLTAPSSEGYSKLRYNWPQIETEYSQLPTDKRCYLDIDETYNVTHHPNNQGLFRNPGERGLNILDSINHSNLIEQSKNVRKSGAYIDFSYSSDSSNNPYETESIKEVRKSWSLISSQENNKWRPRRAAISQDDPTYHSEEDIDSDTDIQLTDNAAYVTVRNPLDNIPVSPYIITKPILPPKPKKL